MLNEAMRSARLVGLLAICGAVIAQPVMAQSGAQSDGRTTAGAQTLFQRLVEAGKVRVGAYSEAAHYSDYFFENEIWMDPVEGMEILDGDGGTKSCIASFYSSQAHYREKVSDDSHPSATGFKYLRIDWTKVSEVKPLKYMNDDNVYVVVSGGTSTYGTGSYLPLEITFRENMGDRVYQAALFLKENCTPPPSSLGRDTGF